MEDREFKTRVMTLRIIWFALLMGQIVFAAVVLFILPPQRRQSPDMLRLMFWIVLAMLLILVPLGLIVRKIIYRGGMDQSGAVSPQAYATGMIVFLAMCEGVGFFGLVCTMLNGGPGPHLVVAVTAMAIQLVSFPTGSPMRSR
jgi:hypothetical protein